MASYPQAPQVPQQKKSLLGLMASGDHATSSDVLIHEGEVMPASAMTYLQDSSSPSDVIFGADGRGQPTGPGHAPACGCGQCGDMYPSTDCGSDAFFVGGWIDQGWTFNPDNPVNKSNRPVVFNDRSDTYLMNQLYLTFGRNVATRGCRWDAGGRVDILFGTDAYYVTADGLETYANGMPHWNSRSRITSRGTAEQLYGVALPQAYAEFYTPELGGWNFKLGHFYSPLGYESVMAPKNFFYSHSYTRIYGLPLTQTGALASNQINRCWTIRAGFTRGWDNWEDLNDTLSFLGGITWTDPRENIALDFNITTGNDQPGLNLTAYSMVAKVRLTERLTYVAEHVLGWQDQGASSNLEPTRDSQWYSLVQYAYLDLTETLSVGARVEWFRDINNQRVFPGVDYARFGGSDYSEITLGANWRPIEHLIIRPEARWDSGGFHRLGSPNPNGAFDSFSSKRQYTTGVSILVVY